MNRARRFHSDEIGFLEKQFRTNLINALSGFKSVQLCGTVNRKKLSNLAIFNSTVHIGANPPLLGIILRPPSVPRHTLQNILDTGFFTLNHVHKYILQQAHQCAARYEQDVSEFGAVGLSEEYSGTIPAPYVKESLIKIGMSFTEIHEIKANGTQLVVGKIEEITVPTHCLGDDGYLDLHRAGSLAIAGLDGYHSTEKLVRLSYARPGSTPEALQGFTA